MAFNWISKRWFERAVTMFFSIWWNNLVGLTYRQLTNAFRSFWNEFRRVAHRLHARMSFTNASNWVGVLWAVDDINAQRGGFVRSARRCIVHVLRACVSNPQKKRKFCSKVVLQYLTPRSIRCGRRRADRGNYFGLRLQWMWISDDQVNDMYSVSNWFPTCRYTMRLTFEHPTAN